MKRIAFILLILLIYAPAASADDSTNTQRMHSAYLLLDGDRQHLVDDMMRLQQAITALDAENAQLTQKVSDLAAQLAWWKDPANRAWVDSK